MLFFERTIIGNQLMHLYEMVHDFVLDSFAGHPRHLPHLERTAYWAKVFRPQIDEAFLCAAVAHDIERAQRKKSKRLPLSVFAP